MEHSLPADTQIGHVRLIVADLERALLFYRDLLGLAAGSGEQEVATLSSPSGEVVVELEAQPQARPRPPHTTGLYHIAIRLPDRPSLAALLQRLLDARYPLQGASDHLVSEAVYLPDPDGNGVELYVDRPRDTWLWQAGQVAMTTKPLDVEGLLSEAGKNGSGWQGIAAGTDMGHIHLQVADLGRAEAFYRGLIGLDVTVRGYPGALFLSAGGYHHHVGLNTWAGRGAAPAPSGTVGLAHFALKIQDEAARQALIARVQAAGLELRPAGREAGRERYLVSDPDSNRVLI